MFFLEPLLERLFNDLMLTFFEKVRFGDPFATQLGSKMGPWGDHFGQNVDFSLPGVMARALLGPTWRPKVAQKVPKRPQGPIFSDLYAPRAPF